MAQIAVNGQIWNYVEIAGGHGGPSLLILHGWGRSGSEWINIGRQLAELGGRRVYVLDLPGFGGSSLPQVKDIFEYSELVVQFCKYLELDKVMIIGHSLGGRVGIVLASQYSELVAQLVLIDPAGVRPRSIKRATLKVISKLFGFVPASWRARIMYRAMDSDYRNSPALRQLYRAVVSHDLRSNLSQIKCKTLVVWGEKDPILPLSLSKVYREKINDCQVRVVWEAGHDSHLSHPRELVRILEAGWI